MRPTAYRQCRQAFRVELNRDPEINPHCPQCVSKVLVSERFVASAIEDHDSFTPPADRFIKRQILKMAAVGYENAPRDGFK